MSKESKKQKKRERREMFKRLNIVEQILLIVAVIVPQIYSFIYLPTFIFATEENMEKLYYGMFVWLCAYAVVLFVWYRGVLSLSDISDRLVEEFFWEYTVVLVKGQLITLVLSLAWGELITTFIAFFAYLLIKFVLPVLAFIILSYFILRKVFKLVFKS